MKSLAAFVVGTALALSANAATVSFSFNNSLQTTPISQTGVLGLFNSSLGTLTGVAFIASGNDITFLSLTNDSAQSQATAVTATTNLYFGSSLGALNGLIASASFFPPLTALTVSVTLASGTTQMSGPLESSAEATVNLGSGLGSFSNSGDGDFTVSCKSISGLTIQDGSVNITASQKTQARCGALIKYTYTPTANSVPEPTSLALMGLALAGVGLMRRKADKA